MSAIKDRLQAIMEARGEGPRVDGTVVETIQRIWREMTDDELAMHHAMRCPVCHGQEPAMHDCPRCQGKGAIRKN